MGTVDLSQVYSALGAILATALVTIAGLLAQTLAKKLGMQSDSALAANLTAAATNGINYAIMQSLDVIKANGWDHPAVSNQLIHAGADYVAQKFPDLLTKAGIDPATAVGRAKIADIVTRALPDAVSAAATSPVTPPGNLVMASVPKAAPVAAAPPVAPPVLAAQPASPVQAVHP